MGDMADRMAQRIAEDGGLGEPADDDAAVAPGTGREGTPPPPQGDTTVDGRQGPPESIPYSRFAEVNGRLNELKQYETLAEYGIEADSALRLANFEAAYVSDPKGIISSLIDGQPDLTEGDKTAMKALLSRSDPSAGADDGDGEGNGEAALSADDRRRLDYIDTLAAERQEAASNAQLDHVVGHWNGLDKADNLDVPERTKLLYIQGAASRGNFATLEELAESARSMYLEDRDGALGSVVQSRGTGTPRSVPGGTAASTPPEKFTDMAAARKQILADAAAGRLPGMDE